MNANGVANLQTKTHPVFIKRCLSLLLVFIVVLSTPFVSKQALAQNQVDNIRVTHQRGTTRVVLDVKDEAKFSYFSLSNPQRLVVDFTGTKDGIDFDRYDLKGPLVKRIRHSTPKSANDMRLVFDLNKKVEARVFSLQATQDFGHRVVVDLKDPNPVPEQVLSTVAAPQRDQDIVIVIDAGHGGADPGSIGPKGTYEKNITLSISKMLEALINNESGLRAVMTRSGDYYISPNDRPDVAIRENADLLVSIHADAFTTPQPRGGSVWVLSKGRADSELGRLLEQTERSSELIGSAANVIEDRDTERYFAETIFNMSMDLSRASSYDISNKVISEMKKVTRMHKKAPQSASLAVLTAPETPSILVEVGFISNPQEEKNLNWREYRQRLANSMFTSIKRYFKVNPPEGTLWAKRLASEPIKHKVARGESLSVIAQRYSVSVKDLKEANNLRSDMVRIGQVLLIPN